MLYLRTGLPGSGKTLNTIREIELEYGPDPKKPDKPQRTVYYYGIPDLDVSKLRCKWVEFDTPEEWFNLPDGSVIVIDEAQRIFGAEDGRKARPEKVTRFETHRHQGFDIVLITQHPSLIMSHVRKLVGKHINMYRPYGGTKLRRHEYEFCIDAPEKRSNFKLAQESTVRLDRKYFGVYKSATVHTHKFKLPNYVWYIPPLVGFILLCGWWVLHLYLPDSTPELGAADAPTAVAEAESAPAASLNAPKPAGIGPAAQPTLSPEQYAESLQPRLEDVPATAPRYDRLTEPVTHPRLACAASTDPRMIDRARNVGYPVGSRDGREYTCQCYTQQATRVATSAEFCMTVVENGLFDDTLPERGKAVGSVSMSPGNVSSAPPVATGRVPAARMPPAGSVPADTVTVINSGKPGHLW